MVHVPMNGRKAPRMVANGAVVVTQRREALRSQLALPLEQAAPDAR
jgi:hypothetical protein